MPLPSTHISSLTDAGAEDPKDKLQFQRNVLGVWQDFHTNIETFMGGLQTAVIEWDGSLGFIGQVEAPVGHYIWPIEIMAVFTPGDAPTSQTGGIYLAIDGGSAYEIKMYDGAIATGRLWSDGTGSSFNAGNTIEFTTTGLAFPFDGTARIIVLYCTQEAI